MKTNTLDFDAQALRERILDLAMRGKLVPQDPNDEPASVLLEKIKTEKEQLVKEKKIKKSKALPEITDDEKPFDIPDSWEWVRLEEIGTITSGGTPKKAEKSYWENGNIPWITPATMSVVQNDIIFNNKDVKKINQNGLDHSSAHLIPANSIVVSSRAPIGYANIVPFDYTTNQGCKSVSTYSNVVNEYLYYSIKFSVPNMYKRASGTTFKEISGTKFGETVIPFPPLSEQSRIAAKIAQLFALLRKVESFTQQYAELQTLLKSKVLDLAIRGKLVKQNPNDESASVLLEKIKAEKAELVKEKKIKKSKPLPPITDEEKPFDIPDSWEWVRLGDIGQIFAGGDRPKDMVHESDVTHKYPIFSNGVKNHGLYGYTSVPRVLDKAITISARGTIGHVELRTIPFLPIIRLITIIPFDKRIVSILFYFLKGNLISSDGSSIPQLTVPKLKPYLIPLPPIEEQGRIVKKIDQILNLVN